MQKVTDPAILQQLNGGTVAPAPQRAPQSAPGVIMGRPKAPDPYKVQQDSISNSQEAERLRIAQQSAALQAEKDALAIAKAQREEASGPAGQADEGERKASGFLKRAINAEKSYSGIDFNPSEAGQQGVEPRSMVGQFMANNVPGLLNSLPAGIGNSTERQQADQAQREFIAAVLRYDSGAAIPPEEFVSNAQIYFPQPGDGPEVIKQKARSREVALQGLLDSSGTMGVGINLQGELGRAPDAANRLSQMGMAAATSMLPQGGPPPDQPSESLLNPLPGERVGNLNTDALGPGDKFLFDENGTPIAIQSADGTISGYSQITDEVSQRDAETALREQGGTGYAEGGEAGLYRGISLGFSDEIAGLGGGIHDMLTGGSFSQGYAKERDIERAAQRISREKAGILPELAGGILAPLGAAKGAKTVGDFAKVGAGTGALGGFGEGEGVQDSIGKAALGSGIGAGGGALIAKTGQGVNALLQTQAGQKITGSLSALRNRSGAVNREVVEAGQRQNIPIRQPDARPETRNAMAVVEASPTQGSKVKQALEADKAAVEARLSEVGGSGTRLDNFSMGEGVQKAGTRYIAKSRTQANALYTRAQQAAGGTKIPPAQAMKAIDDNIAELTANGPKGNAGQIKYLKDLKSDLSRGDLSIDQLRSIRTAMRGQIGERNLTGTDAERRVGQVISAASADIEKGLAGNPKALGAYKAADKFYQEKQTFIKDVVQKFTGPRNSPFSAEQAASKFQAMMRDKGDYKRFSEMLSRLDKSERADMAATIAEKIGTSRNGEFSLAALATDVSKMNPRALRDLFGEDGAKALADLRIIARAKADTLGGLNNSKSGVVSAGTNQFKDVLLGMVGGGMAGVPGAVTGMAVRGGVERFTSARAARLLLNPDFTKWLRQTPASTSAEVINRHFDRLNKLAARDSVFLMDAKALQDYLRSAVSQTPSRAAAEGQQEEDRR